MRILIAGSRSIQRVPDHLMHFIRVLVSGADVINLRRPQTITDRAPIGHVELAAAGACAELHVQTKWWMPEPSDRTRGRVSVFVRDIDIVAGSDLVVAILDPLYDEYSGTNHIVEKALDQAVPVYVFTPGLERIGEWDSENMYGRLIDAALNT